MRRYRSPARAFPPGGECGYTLVEVLFASVVLLIVATGFVLAASVAVRGAMVSKQRTVATQLANRQIEKARNLPFDSVGTHDGTGGYGNPPGSILTPETIEEYTVVTTVRWIVDAGQAAYKRVDVTVKYPGGAVSAATNIFGKSTLVNVGTMVVTAFDRDTGQPISMATIRCDPQGFGSTRVDSTDESGAVTFAGLDPGTYDVSGTASTYLDARHGTVTTQTISAGGVTNVMLPFQRPSHMQFTVRDPDGHAITGAQVRLTGPFNLDETLDAGGAVCTFDDLYVGSYSYTASAPGYSTVYGTAQVASGSQTVVVPTVTLVPAGSLVVTVLDNVGQPVPAASVTVRGPTETTSSAVPGGPFTTNAQGQASLSGLAPGNYQVDADRTGYTPAAGTVAVTAGGNAQLTLTLVPSGPSTGDLTVRPMRGGAGANNYRLKVTGPGAYDSGDRYTNSSGYVYLTNLAPGTYYVWVYKRTNPNRGYQSSYQSQGSVIAGQTTVLVVSYPW